MIDGTIVNIVYIIYSYNINMIQSFGIACDKNNGAV
jgi:hypothetical protein